MTLPRKLLVIVQLPTRVQEAREIGSRIMPVLEEDTDILGINPKDQRIIAALCVNTYRETISVSTTETIQKAVVQQHKSIFLVVTDDIGKLMHELGIRLETSSSAVVVRILITDNKVVVCTCASSLEKYLTTPNNWEWDPLASATQQVVPPADTVPPDLTGGLSLYREFEQSRRAIPGFHY